MHVLPDYMLAALDTSTISQLEKLMGTGLPVGYRSDNQGRCDDCKDTLEHPVQSGWNGRHQQGVWCSSNVISHAVCCGIAKDPTTAVDTGSEG